MHLEDLEVEVMEVSQLNFLKFKITPLSPFATPPKGDVVFGMFAKILFLEGKGEDKFSGFPEKISIIFSDFLPEGYLPKPALPPSVLGVGSDSLEKKAFKKKQFLEVGEIGKALNTDSFSDDNPISTDKRAGVEVSRLTGKHRDGSLFITDTTLYKSDLVLYVAYDKEKFSEEDILETLQKVGKFGFGKKSSVGFGQFEAKKEETDLKNLEIFGQNLKNGIGDNPSFIQGATIGVEIELGDHDFPDFPEGTPYLTLSPSVPKEEESPFYNLYQKFGKHGSDQKQIFKKHSLMADSGAVYFK
jgi:CRISPR/Cas system CSM-associated protein Csm4 (group 5 of RAMP superfamily)